MTWFKVDDNLSFHPKALMAGNAAMGLWVRAGSWAAQQLTDGYVPAQMARQLGSESQIKALLDAGLWVHCGDSYAFHDWNESGRQPTRKQVESRRAASAERLRKWREQQHRDNPPTSLRSV